MRKNDLIKKLNEIHGNPHVVLWNGYVGDYNNIGGVEEEYLYRQSKKFYFEINNLSRQRDGLEPIKFEEYEFKAEYEFPNRFLDEDKLKEWYDNKMKIIILEPKERRKEVWDRVGKINY